MKFITGKFYWLLFLCLLAGMQDAAAQKKKPKQGKGNTESQLIFRINACVANEDPYCYLSLFPDMDTLSKLVMTYSSPSSREYREMAALQQNPVEIMHLDSVFHARLKQGFEDMMAQGKLLGIHWQSTIQVRYELVRAFKTRDTVYEKLAPTRFTGYLFVMDQLTRKTYCFTVSEMLQIQDEWYGGYLGDIFEASNKDEYDDARIAAKKEKKEPKDTAATVGEPVKAAPGEEEDEANDAVQKLIVERKFYSGMFDNEIPVQLYVRSLKGDCKEVICKWEAIYKFGDQDDYILLKVERMEDGKWQFTESPAAASMELSLKSGVYTGSWIANDNQTGYEVKLSEMPVSKTKLERLEAAFLSLRQ